MHIYIYIYIYTYAYIYHFLTNLLHSRIILNYVKETHGPTHTQWSLDVESIYNIERHGESSSFVKNDVNIYTCICIYIYTYTYIYAYIYFDIYIYMYMCIYMYTIYTYMLEYLILLFLS